MQVEGIVDNSARAAVYNVVYDTAVRTLELVKPWSLPHNASLNGASREEHGIAQNNQRRCHEAQLQAWAEQQSLR